MENIQFTHHRVQNPFFTELDKYVDNLDRSETKPVQDFTADNTKIILSAQPQQPPAVQIREPSEAEQQNVAKRLIQKLDQKMEKRVNEKVGQIVSQMEPIFEYAEDAIVEPVPVSVPSLQKPAVPALKPNIQLVKKPVAPRSGAPSLREVEEKKEPEGSSSKVILILGGLALGAFFILSGSGGGGPAIQPAASLRY